MSEFKGTPGPWIAVYPDCFNDCEITAKSRKGKVSICAIKYAYKDDPQDSFECEQKANAQLILAAPELLEVLLEIKEWDISNFKLDIPLPLRKKMQNVMAKALGKGDV